MTTPRLRLYGKKVSEEQINSEIYNLVHGVGEKSYPMTVTETAKFLGMDVIQYMPICTKCKSQKNAIELFFGIKN